MAVADELTGARLTVQRRLAWAETDAAGHNHFSSAIRWLEECEHDLWRLLGLTDLVPFVPRVHVEIDYRERVWFAQGLAVTVGVIHVGRSSCTFGFTAVTEEGHTSSEGRHTVVHTPLSGGGAAPWPDEVRRLLETPTQLQG